MLKKAGSRLRTRAPQNRACVRHNDLPNNDLPSRDREGAVAPHRGTENTTRFKLKLPAHWHFIVKHNLPRQEPYNVHAIRAVLIESTEKNWASVLRDAARHPVVSSKPSPLFWFTTSELFFSPPTATTPAKPLYIEQSEIVFKRIWATPVEDKFLNLDD